jgi:CubicO group peptidase (beta-lactamase class C family)
MKRRLILFFAISLALAGQDFSAIDAAARAEMESMNIPGAAIAIVKGDRVVYAKAFGVLSAEGDVAVTPDSLFRLGSTTKMFTAAAVAGLALDGKLSLEDPVGKYIAGLDPRIGTITAAQLLSHTAGLRDEAPMFGSDDEAALGNGVRAWKGDWFFTEPGKIFSYSNPGYWLAGYLAETVAGKPYADVLAERLFVPLGMKRSTLRPAMAMTWPLAQGHEASPKTKAKVIRPAANNAATWPAGSIFSSVNDLSRFVIAFLNGGRLEGVQVLSPGLIGELARPRTAYPGSPRRSYAFGLTVSSERGVKLVEHGGARSGYGSGIRMAAEQRVGIITVANVSGQSLSRTAEKASELMLSLEPPEKRSNDGTPVTAGDAAIYAGVYANGAVKTEIAVKDGVLVARIGSREAPVRKTPDGWLLIGDARVFPVVENGRAAYLHSASRSLARQ